MTQAHCPFIMLIGSLAVLQSVVAALPSDLQQMLTTIEKEAISYPSRASDLDTLRRWMADGDYDLARSKAASIINQQRNLRQ